tara:strand:- start:693 stop:1586 length:894 start_codon:yes stop_codon:yes gene_type:complete
MNILIAGSSGFLGSHCVNYFRNKRHNVLGVDITESSTTDIVDDIRFFVQHSQQRFDLLLQFAADVKGREHIEKHYLNMIENIEIDRCVFKWASTYVDHIIYPSSCAVYPEELQQNANTPLIESMINFETGVIGVSDHLYGWSKLTAERMLWQIHKEIKLPIHVIRPFSGYGPGQSTDYPMTNLVNMIKNNPNKIQVWGNGTQTRDWIFIDDIVQTIEWCINDTIGYRTLNIGTGIATPFTELLQIIYRTVYNKECPEIETLLDKPSGVPHRVANIQLQSHLGLLPRVDLLSGIKTLL